MRSRKVLIVEDDDQIRQTLVEYLANASQVEVAAARDGADALHAVQSADYDVVVLDVMMPYMNGIDFLDSVQILKPPEERPACFIVTGVPAEELPSETIERRFAGMVRRVFRKPIDPCELVRCIDEVLR
ncbi:MAG TPA: response regulator [Thermoanaerobaculia bacterium]|jgi:CheY-like chemotaxis protein